MPPAPHLGGMPHVEMGVPPQHQQPQHPPGPEAQWAPQEPQWSPQLQQAPGPQVGAPGQFPQGAVQVPAQYQPDQTATLPPGWPPQQPAAPAAGKLLYIYHYYYSLT